MPLATITETTLNTGFKRAQLMTTLKAAMTSAGFDPVFDEVPGPVGAGTIILVYRQVFNPNVTKGTLYLRIEIYDYDSSNGFRFYVSILDNWNATTHTGTNPSYITDVYYFQPAYSCTFTAINHPELRTVMLRQPSNNLAIYLGYLRPANIPAWWDENQFLYAFFTYSFYSYYGIPTTGSPFNVSNSSGNFYRVVINQVLVNPNAIDNSRTLQPGLLLQPSFNNQGLIGRTSDDLSLVCGFGLNRYRSLTTGTERYYVLYNEESTYTSSGILIQQTL